MLGAVLLVFRSSLLAGRPESLGVGCAHGQMSERELEAVLGLLYSYQTGCIFVVMVHER